MLRFCNPVHYMRRTATGDTELGDKQIQAGDKVAVYYTSANRDEAVFADPQTFDIRRTPNSHLSFGIASHFCLGAHVARLQAAGIFRGAPVRLFHHRAERYAREGTVEPNQWLSPVARSPWPMTDDRQ